MRNGMLAVLLLVLGGVVVTAQDDSSETEADPEEAAEEDAEEEESLEDLLKRIEKNHDAHKDFKGKFEQERYLPLFDDTVESKGRFVFKKPDHVRWEYTSPNKSILVVTGDSGRKWSEGTNRTESFELGDDRGLDAVVKQLFTWFRGKFTGMTDDYEVEVIERSPAALKMTPKKEAVKKHIAAIEVRFNESEEEIESVKIIEPKGEGDDKAAYTLYEFKETKLDSGVKDEEFKINK